MRVGRMRHSVVFKRSVDNVETTVCTLFCAVTTASGSKNQDMVAGYDITNWRFRTRKDSRPTTKDVAFYNDRELMVEAIMPDRTDEHYMLIDCREVES